MTTLDRWFGCLRWIGRKTKGGYGLDGTKLAHVAAYEKRHGPVPAGLVLDHAMCRRRDCVNPVHLEAVTQSENLRRRSWAYRVKRTHCNAGHELAVHGRRTPEAGVVCRVCSRVWRPEAKTGPDPG